MNALFRKKSIEQLQQDGAKNTGLNRVLGLWQLTAIGLGGIIGVGIFVLTGVAAAEHAGPTLLIGLITAFVAGVTPINEVAELVNIGTLTAFILICSSIIVLRVKRPDLKRGFKTPLVPIIPIIGIGLSAYLIASLPPITFIRFIAWMAIGLVVYFLYGKKRSTLQNTNNNNKTKIS